MVESKVQKSDLAGGTQVSKVDSFAKLTVLDGGVSRTYVLYEDTYTIGRKHDNKIRLTDKFVSKYHATLRRNSDVDSASGYVYHLHDGGPDSATSKNGVEVNGNKISACVLQSGDSIKFGPHCSAVYTEVFPGRNNHPETLTSVDIVEQYRKTLTPTQSSFETIAKELNETQERYELVLRGTNDGIWDWNLISNEIYYSPRWKSILGYDENHISSVLDEWFERVHPDDVDRLKKQIVLHLSGKTPYLENEHRILSAEREYRWVLCRGMAIRDTSSNAYRIAGSITDIDKIKKVNSQLLKAVFHDELTGLPNRKNLNHILENILSSRSKGQENRFGLLFLDLDRFKQINDSLGHNVGDRLLVIVAQRLQLAVRLSDIVFRLGGDEFIVLLKDTHQIEEMLPVVDRIVEAVIRPIQVDGHEIFTSTSIGVVFCQGQYADTDSILRDADIAMYEAKAQPEISYAIFDSNMHAKVSSRMQLETELRQAISHEEFILFYQPIFSAGSNSYAGCEALIRWNSSVDGIRGPGQFIDVAEDTGLIIPITDFVLSEACRQIKQWSKSGLVRDLFYINVNVSPKYISQPDFDDKILDRFSQFDINPSKIRLEITENLFLKDSAMASAKLQRLRDAGIKIYIDDFGTGYCSLGYLKNLPIDALKIDKSFVDKLLVDSINSQIVEVILKLAQAMKINAIAEGVETLQQYEYLRNLGCNLMQGYFFSKPQSPEDFAQNLSEMGGGFSFSPM